MNRRNALTLVGSLGIGSVAGCLSRLSPGTSDGPLWTSDWIYEPESLEDIYQVQLQKIEMDL